MRAGEVLIIVGAAGDIGCSIASVATALGVKVIGWDQCFATDGDDQEFLFESYSLDCSDPKQVAITMQQVLDKHGRVDAMIAAAGQLLLSPFVDVNKTNLDACFASNIYANFYPLQAATKVMMQQRYGRMLLLSSDQAYHGRSAGAAYSMSKAALLRLPAVITAELVDAGDIRINTLLLGTVAETKMTEQAAEYFAATGAASLNSIKRQFYDEIPTRQLVDKKRLASWAMQLCGLDATDFAAAVFSMDGGLTAVR